MRIDGVHGWESVERERTITLITPSAQALPKHPSDSPRPVMHQSGNSAFSYPIYKIVFLIKKKKSHKSVQNSRVEVT